MAVQGICDDCGKTTQVTRLVRINRAAKPLRLCSKCKAREIAWRKKHGIHTR